MQPAASVRFRAFDPADAAEVTALWHEAWHDAHAALCPPEVVRHRTLESFARRLGPLAPGIVVAEDDVGIAGFAALVEAEIDQFYLSRRARGTGLAARLMARSEDILRTRRFHMVEIDCIAGNERALRFYAARGYVETAFGDRPVWMPGGAAATLPVHRLAKPLDH